MLNLLPSHHAIMYRSNVEGSMAKLDEHHFLFCCVLLTAQQIQRLKVMHKPGLPHAVPGDAGVDPDGLVAVELVDVSGPQVLAVLEPRQYRRGEAHHLALERHHPLVRQVGAQFLHEHRSPIIE